MTEQKLTAEREAEIRGWIQREGWPPTNTMAAELLVELDRLRQQVAQLEAVLNAAELQADIRLGVIEKLEAQLVAAQARICERHCAVCHKPASQCENTPACQDYWFSLLRLVIWSKRRGSIQP